MRDEMGRPSVRYRIRSQEVMVVMLNGEGDSAARRQDKTPSGSGNCSIVEVDPEQTCSYLPFLSTLSCPVPSRRSLLTRSLAQTAIADLGVVHEVVRR